MAQPMSNDVKKVIWKYVMGMATTHTMPRGAELLAVQMQLGELCAWFLVVPSAPQEPRKFKTYGTGWDIPLSERYMGTAQDAGGSLVWHLFEDIKASPAAQEGK